ncbi:hypothetical protein GGI21_005865, partial [Coemansia aciculifera]
MNQLPITILRVKRKRGQEPLDALVIQQRLKRAHRNSHLSRTAAAADEDDDGGCATPQLFALGETISETDFGDIQKRQALQARLAQLSALSSSKKDDADAMDIEEKEKDTSMYGAVARQTVQPQFRVQAKRQVPLDSTAAVGVGGIRGIPQVVAAADLRRQQQQQSITVFDAVTEEEPNRLPMLRDPYAEIALGRPLPTPSSSAVDALVPMVRDCMALDSGGPEYVYDFYYARQAQASDSLLSMGAVTWLGDDDPDDSSSEEDGDDEDSNSEGYYANDYPDDEEEEV